MSDLSATNCGCGCVNERSNGCGCEFGNNSCIWIILLLLFCGGNSWGSNRGGCGCDDSCIWIIILLFCCGGFGGNGCGSNRSGCGCGCDDMCC